MGDIDGSDHAPTDATKLGEWKIKDARVMTWILGSIDPLIVLNLRSYKTAKAMWNYLQKVYNQDNSARRFQLEYEIANYSQGVIQAVHEQSKRDQFLMKLCSDFENVRSNLMNRDPSPSLDKENDVTVAFAAQGKGKGKDMSRTQCYSCKEYGHIASNCSKKFCNYCKQQGHIIKECPTRPQNRRINAFQARINGSTDDNSSSGQVLTTEMVQQMIVSAFSTLGLQGASNHMTNSTSILKNVRKYQGPSQIHIANGSNLPITKVGDITPTFKNDQVSGTIIAKGPKMIIVGLHGCIFFDPNLRNVVFFENQYFFPTIVDSSSVSPLLPTFEDLSSSFKRFKPGFVYERRRPTLPYPDTDLPLETAPQLESENSSRSGPLEPTQRSTRVSRTPNWYGFSSTLSNISVLSCYSQASKHEYWLKAMEEKLLALKENDTWDIVSCPSNVRPIGCKWVYSIKLHSDGTLDRYKARLVFLVTDKSMGWTMRRLLHS
ncbi:hypothetical protein KY290_013671 [Solanum tuberosum]|uniref:CCHC-type domain-containing protein n=1 Tax=Solanum tuberosum TaxID=4113 RepID=A0ABQ7VMD4_SOLTU|nr:hypothetical protein KY289_013795 [Solanum tuberosum]KAH0769690.1 hypothetical protein KY290_013671 [Solanum tuberosum]